MILPETGHGAAVALADAGYAVFPVLGKVPFKGTRGFLDATRDYDVIDAMFRDRPESGVAIATGAVSGVWVLDMDGEDGADSLRCLIDEFGPLPETVTATTPNGSHRFYEHVEGIRNTAGKVAPGIDTRGGGGYVVVDPSPHPDGGTYQWARDPFNHEIVPAPGWLVELALARPAETFPTEDEVCDTVTHFASPTRRLRYIAAAIEAECSELARTPEGQRNHQLNRSAYTLARFVQAGDIGADIVARHLAAAAARAGLGQREINKTLRSAFRARGAA